MQEIMLFLESGPRVYEHHIGAGFVKHHAVSEDQSLDIDYGCW